MARHSIAVNQKRIHFQNHEFDIRGVLQGAQYDGLDHPVTEAARGQVYDVVRIQGGLDASQNPGRTGNQDFGFGAYCCNRLGLGNGQELFSDDARQPGAQNHGRCQKSEPTPCFCGQKAQLADAIKIENR